MLDSYKLDKIEMFSKAAYLCTGFIKLCRIIADGLGKFK
jgi:hypothetical protein